MTALPDIEALKQRLAEIDAAERKLAGEMGVAHEETINWQFAEAAERALMIIEALQGEMSLLERERGVRLSTITALQDHVARLEKVLEREWLPIETAPMDGTEVLLAFKDADSDWCQIAGWYEAGQADRQWYDIYHGACEPTHWMPLPGAPPALAIAGEEKRG